MFRYHRLLMIPVAAVLLLTAGPPTATAGVVSADTLHKVLGYGTIGLAGATVVTSSDGELHKSFAWATAGCALATVLTGVMENGDRFDTSEGLLGEDNRHILAGAIGAAALVTAVLIADDGEESSHSGFGVAGGILMSFAVVDIRF